MKAAPNQIVLAFTTALTVTGCSWVDSTGRSHNDAPEIQFDGGATALQEQGTLRIPVKDDSATSVSFRLLDSGKTVASACGEWFSVADSADELQDACVYADNCTVNFDTDPLAENIYLLTAPAISQPIALQYNLIAEDADGKVDSQVFSLCIQSINDAPDTQPDQYTVEYQQELDMPGVVFDPQCEVRAGQGVLDNDRDDRDYQSTAATTGECMSAHLVDAPSAHQGNFELKPNGGFRYVSSGHIRPGDEDTFTYTAYDGDHQSQETTVTIKITGENTPPVAIPNNLLIASQGYPLIIQARVLASDPEGLELSATPLEAPSHGTAVRNNGDLVYTSHSNYIGNDSFKVKVSDPAGASTVVTANIVVQATNLPPVIAEIIDIEKTYSDTPAAVDIISVPFRVTDAETGNPVLQVEAISSARPVVAVQSISALDGTGRGELSLQPLSNGTATITLRATDTPVGSLPAESSEKSFTVSISGMKIRQDNTRPDARNDNFAIQAQETRTFDVTKNDRDEDGDALYYRIINSGQLGNKARISVDGLLTVTAPIIYYDRAYYWIEYGVDDGYGGTDTAFVLIKVNQI